MTTTASTRDQQVLEGKRAIAAAETKRQEAVEGLQNELAVSYLLKSKSLAPSAPGLTETYDRLQAAIATAPSLSKADTRRIFWTAVFNICVFVISHYDRRDEYRLMAQIAKLKTKRWFIRRAIAVAEFIAYNGFANKVAKVWSCKGELTTKALDKVSALN